MEPVPPAIEAWSLNHWTAEKSQDRHFKDLKERLQSALLWGEVVMPVASSPPDPAARVSVLWPSSSLQAYRPLNTQSFICRSNAC